MQGKQITLGEYVAKLMAEKSITERDIEKRSGRKISSAYVNQIKNGEKSKLSPPLILALAKGLGVSEIEVFLVAAGLPLDPEASYSNDESDLLRDYRDLDEFDRKQVRIFTKYVAHVARTGSTQVPPEIEREFEPTQKDEEEVQGE